MELKIKYLILTSALLLAFLLFLFGIRRLRISDKKNKGFFLTALIIALASVGCNISNSGETESNSEPMKNQAVNTNPKRIKDLNNTPEWRAFKTLWKTLDNVLPQKNKNDGSFYAYTEMDDYNKKYKLVDSLNKKNDECKYKLARLTGKKLLTKLEVDLLTSITSERIKFIYYGNTSMMTRMLPLPGTYEKENSISSLEYKIDTLLLLERKGKIDSSELNLAVRNIEKEVYKYSILNILMQSDMLKYYSYGYGTGLEGEKKDTISIIDKSLLDFENDYNGFMKTYDPQKANKAQKTIYEKYNTTKMQIDEFTNNYLLFLELIRDLVVNV